MVLEGRIGGGYSMAGRASIHLPAPSRVSCVTLLYKGVMMRKPHNRVAILILLGKPQRTPARSGWALAVRDQSHLLPARRVIGARVAVVHARHQDGALIGGLYAETHARRSQPVARKRVRLAATTTSIIATAATASSAAPTTAASTTAAT